jgi:hypothetical protein
MAGIPDAEAVKDIDPILALFGAEDGGVAFAKLRFGFLPELYSKEGKTPSEEAFVEMFKRFSRFCQMMLDSPL